MERTGSTENERKMLKAHPYAIIRHLRISVVLIILSVIQQFLYRPQNILEIIGSLGINALYVLFSVSYAVTLYQNFKYRIERDKIMLHSGVFIQKYFRIPFEKVCTVIFYRDIFSALFGAEKISLDTPADSRKKFDVSAYISVRRARESLHAAESKYQITSHYHSGMISIFLMSAFWSNPLTGLIFIVPVIHSIGQIIGSEMTGALVRGSINTQSNFWMKYISPAAATLIAVILLSWVISLMLSFLRYVRFHSYRLGEFIVIFRGFPSRSITMTKVSELASVNVDQSLLMKILRLKSCSLSVIGSGKLKGDRGLIISPEKNKNVYQKMKELTGICTEEMQKVGVAKKSWFAYIYPVIISLLIPLGFFMLRGVFPRFKETTGLLGTISLFVIGWWFLFRIFAYRSSYLAVNRECLIVCGFRKLTMRKHYIKLNKIQKIEIQQSIFQRISGKCNIKVYVYFEKRNVCRVKQLPLKQTAKLLKEMELLY